jgi:hypothetical protein
MFDRTKNHPSHCRPYMTLEPIQKEVESGESVVIR